MSGTASLNSFIRQFSAPKGVDMASYGANHFNDDVKGFFEFLLYNVSFHKVDLRHKAENLTKFGQKKGELDIINHIIYSTICSSQGNTNSLSKEFEINGVPKKVTLTQTAKGVKVEFGFIVIEEYVVGGHDFNSLKELLEPQIKFKFSDFVEKSQKVIHHLCYQKSLNAVEIDRDGYGNVFKKIEQHPCPGGYDFVTILAGNTENYSGNNTTIDNSATTLLYENMFAATVVDGIAGVSKPAHVQTYSELITVAALYTVKYGVLEKKLFGWDLQDFFYQAIQTGFLNSHLTYNPNLAVAFAGVVLYFDNEGHQKQFSYGLGSTALVAIDSQNKNETLHLQGNFGSSRHTKHNTATEVAALGQNPRVHYAHVTAQVSSVIAKSIQIISNGCLQEFFTTFLVKKATGNTPAKLRVEEKVIDSAEQSSSTEKDSNTKIGGIIHLNIDVNAAFAAIPQGL